MNQILKIKGVNTLSKETQKEVSGGRGKRCNPANDCCIPVYSSNGNITWVHSTQCM